MLFDKYYILLVRITYSHIIRTQLIYAHVN